MRPERNEPRQIASSANVRPAFSFAKAAAGKKEGGAADDKEQAQEKQEGKDAETEALADKVADVQI